MPEIRHAFSVVEPGRVLSIQSHVVRGYVGNKAAVFPLQLLGHHVDVINSVQYTSMYIHEGEKLNGSDLKLLLETLALAEIPPGPNDHPGPLLDKTTIDVRLPVQHKYLLTGYVGTATFIRTIVEFVKQQKINKAQLMWVCDPVMGDNGRLYVPADVVEAYKNEVVPFADILTPNQYELEWLCDSSIKNVTDAIDCCKKIHQRGPKVVIATSLSFELESDLILLASEKVTNNNQEITYRHYEINFPNLNVYLGGTGDLMAAMILDGYDRFNGDVKKACERSLGVLQGIIKKTLKHKVKWNDIDIIGSMEEILSPTEVFKAKLI